MSRPDLRVHTVDHTLTDGPVTGVLRCPISPRSGIARVWGSPATGGAALLSRVAAHPDTAGVDDARMWWAVVQHDDGRVAAVVSSTTATGLYWTLDTLSDGTVELVIGPRLGDVVQARRAPTHLDDQFVADFLAVSVGRERTPYRDVACVPPGCVAEWRRITDAPRLREWSGPSTWPAPTVGGPDTLERYRHVFDTVVDQLTPVDGPLCTSLSGGLDSTFVVASLLRHAAPDRPILAFTHVPHPDAPLGPHGQWDPDDSHIAAVMEERHPGLVHLERIANHDMRQPLDAAAERAAATWAPTFATANLVWIDEMQTRARALGATTLFTGENGNAAFSATHTFAASHHLRHGEFGQVAGLVRDGMTAGESFLTALRRRVVGPLVAPYRGRGRRRQQLRQSEHLGLRPNPAAAPPRFDRELYLNWMRDMSALRIAMQPLDERASWLDPFRAHRVLELAASMTPREWRRGIADRGYARLLGEGRVPDEIRLRTRRGGQSWDHWFLVRNQRDRYLDEVRALRSTPVLCDAVDVDKLERAVAGLPWGEPAQIADISTVDRILALGAFVRTTNERLSALHPH